MVRSIELRNIGRSIISVNGFIYQLQKGVDRVLEISVPLIKVDDVVAGAHGLSFKTERRRNTVLPIVIHASHGGEQNCCIQNILDTIVHGAKLHEKKG